MVKKDVWHCSVCGKGIIGKERYVILGTYEDIKVIEQTFYHVKCFEEWFNSKVKEKSVNVVKMAGGKIMGMLQGMMPKE